MAAGKATLARKMARREGEIEHRQAIACKSWGEAKPNGKRSLHS